MTKRLNAFLDVLLDQFRFIVAIAGLTLLSVGLALVYAPLALIVPGGLMFALASLASMRGTARQTK